MTLVVDASVAIRWYVEASGTPAAIAILDSDDPLVAPDLVVAEITNVTWKMVRAGQISQDHGARIAAVLPTAFSNLVSAASLATRALEISSHLDHPVYDSIYIALAELQDARLITADDRLIRTVQNTEWESLVLGLTDS